MTVTIKTAEDIAGMRVAGRLAAEVLEMIGEYVKPGVTTDELNTICHDYIVNVQKAIPAPLNYGGAPGRMPFPKSICTSINHVVCHGIPNDKPLKNGDALNIDVTVIKDGYHGDTSKMFMVGEVPEWVERLSRVTQECMYKGISVVRPGARLGDIGAVIQEHAHANAFSGDIACFFGCLDGAGSAHVVNRLLDITFSGNQSLFALHHALTGTLAQFFDQCCSNFCHGFFLT